METKQTLGGILSKLQSIENAISPDNFEFDPEKLIGELNGKVEAIKWRLDQWNAETEIFKQWAKAIIQKAKALEARSERLKEYVRYKMEEGNYTTLPGDVFRIDLRNSQDKIEVQTEPNAAQYLRFSNLMKQKTEYSWDKTALKKAIASGEKLDIEYSITKSKHIAFEIRDNDK